MFRNNDLQRAAEHQSRYEARRMRHGAEEAWHDGQGLVSRAMNRVSERFQDTRDAASPWLDRTAAEAQDLTQRTVDGVVHAAQVLRDQALVTGALTSRYVRRHPARSATLLLAGAAVVWGLMALNRQRRQKKLTRRAEQYRQPALPHETTQRHGDERGSDLPGAAQAMREDEGLATSAR